jgi:hypothetical protein
MREDLEGVGEAGVEGELKGDAEEAQRLQVAGAVESSGVDGGRRPLDSTGPATMAFASTSSLARKTSSGWPATCPGTSVAAKLVLNALTIRAPADA